MDMVLQFRPARIASFCLLLFSLSFPHHVCVRASRSLFQAGVEASSPSSPEDFIDMKVCLPTPLESSDDVSHCEEVLTLAGDKEKGIRFSCISGGSVDACVNMVKDDVAQITKLPASGLMVALREKIRPVVAEFFSEDLGENTEGYSVAIVNADWCYQQNATTGAEIPPSLALLQNQNACFSGYRRDGSWQVAMGALFRDGGLKGVSKSSSTADDAEAALSFFKDICAPGFQETVPKKSGGKYTKMCDLCGNESDGSCGVNDTVYGNGIVQCQGDAIFAMYPLIDPDALPPETPAPETPAPETPAPAPDDSKALSPSSEEETKAPKSTNTETSKSSNATPTPTPKSTSDSRSPSPAPKNKSDSSSSPAPAAKSKSDSSSPSSTPAPVSKSDASSSDNSSNKSSNTSGNDTSTSKNRRLMQNRNLKQIWDVPEWAGKLLLCGSKADPPCQPFASYNDCNLARVPSPAFAMREDFASSETGRLAAEALVNAGSSRAFLSQGHTVGYPPFSLITPGTQKLTAVDLSQKASNYFEDQFVRQIEGFESLLSAEAGAEAEDDGSGGGLSTAAIIGISAAAVVVVVSVIIVVVVLIQKRKNSGWKRYQDAVRGMRGI